MEIVSSTKVLFWNKGNLGIRRDDISPEKPLKITYVPNVELLDVMQLQLSDEANPLSVERVDNKTALLTFNYLGKNDGGVVQVLHTGTSSEDINVVGTIMDADLRYIDLYSAIRGCAKVMSLSGILMLALAVAAPVGLVLSQVQFLLQQPEGIPIRAMTAIIAIVGILSIF